MWYPSQPHASDSIIIGGGEQLQLFDGVEEAKHAFHEQLRGTFVVVGKAAVSEHMPIDRIHEQLSARDGLNELARGREALQRPLAGLHHVDMEWNSRRPGAPTLGGRECGPKV